MSAAGHGVGSWSEGPPLRLQVRHADGSGGARHRSVGVGAGPGSGKRVSAWMVRAIILATTAFALLDLSLLVSGLRH